MLEGASYAQAPKNSMPSKVTAVGISKAPAPTIVAAEKPAKKLSLLASAAHNSSLYIKDEAHNVNSNDYLFIGTYAITPRLTLGTRLDASEDSKDDIEGPELAASTVFADITLGENKAGTWSTRTTVVLPNDKVTQYQSLEYGLSQRLRLIMSPKLFFSDKLGIDMAANIGRNFHKYQEAESGAVNNQYSSTQYIEFSWAFSEAIGISANFTHKNTWTYQNVAKEIFDFSQELGLQINENFALAVGHNNNGNVLAADNSSSNVNIEDENNSTIYGSVTVTY